jgi:hypothetical protein
MSAQRVQRFDVYALPSKVQRTPQGGLRVPATLTRAGVFVYKDAQGGERRELRHPDDVFAPAAMATLRGAPVTVDHPMVAVRGDNWADLAKGHVGDNVHRDGDHLDGDIILMDGKAVGRVDRKELAECSCGYECDYDPTPGVYEGERYDGRQSNHVYNHVAIGPVGWARGGSSVRMHTDGTGTSLAWTAYPANMSDPVNPSPTPVIPVAEFEKVRAERDTVQARVDASEARTKTLEGQLTAAQTRIDALEAQALGASLAPFLPRDFKGDGKSPRDLMVAALEAQIKGFDSKGRSDEYLRARLDALPAPAPEAPASNPLTVFRPNAPAAPATEVRADADPIAASMAKRAERNRARFDSYQAPVNRLDSKVARFTK